MQYALHDLRRWGFKKIIRYYDNEVFENRQYLLGAIQSLNTKIYDKKSSAYSSIRMWNTIEESLKSIYFGMHLLMLNVEPLITSISVDKACQRRFKNVWTSLWKAFGNDTDIGSSDIAVLSDLGIRLCYISMKDLSLDDKCILNMFNVLLIWYVITSSEVNLDAFRFYPLELIDKMIILSCEEFVNYIIDSVRGDR